MTPRPISSVLGAIHDVARLKEMGDEPCNVIAVSEGTLNIIQNYAIDEVTFLSRYGVSFQGGDYVPVDPAHPDYGFVLDTIRKYRLEVNDLTCDLVEAINGLSAVISGSSTADCACQIGSDVETTDGEEGGDLPDPVSGVEYAEPSAIEDRKCLASNYVHQSVRDVVNELKLNRADQYAFAGLQFVLTLVSTVIGGLIAGPFGLLAGAVVGEMLAMALGLFKASFSLTILLTAITADEETAVCVLYEATSASEARDAYLSVLDDEGATSVELEFVEHLLSNNVLNLLFFAWGDSEDVIADVTPEIDCAVCACDTPGSYDFAWGSVVVGTANVEGEDFTVRTEFDSTWHRIILTLTPAGGCSCRDYNIEVVSADPAFTGVSAGLIRDCASVDVWRWNVQGYGAIFAVWEARHVDVANTVETDVVLNITRIP